MDDEQALEKAKSVIDLAKYNAEKESAMEIDEFIAHEIVDLAEWCCPNAEMKDYVIRKILVYGELSEQVKQLIFDINPIEVD